jgi:hypothetical protein
MTRQMKVCGEAVGKYHDEHGESLPQHRRLRFYLHQFTMFFPRKLYWRGASRFSMHFPSAHVSQAETSDRIPVETNSYGASQHQLRVHCTTTTE